MAVVLMILAVAGWALGCGGSESLENAPEAKPTDIGDPSQYSVGAVKVGAGTHWVAVADASGTKQLRVFVNRVNALDKTDVALGLEYDPQAQQFYSKGREYTYNLDGAATWKQKKGPNVGQTGPRMIQRPVEIDSATGKARYYGYQTLKREERGTEGKDYIVVP